MVTRNVIIGKTKIAPLLPPPLLPKITAISCFESEHRPFDKGLLCFSEVLKECFLLFPSVFLTVSK